MFNTNYGYNLPQQRLMNYEQQYIQPHQQMQMPMQQTYFKMIAVTNEQEANATPVDIMNGTPTFFYNKSSNEIYMKQSLPNGTANFVKFGLLRQADLRENTSSNANLYDDKLNAINDKLDTLLATVPQNSTTVKETVDGNSRGNKNVK